MTEKNIPKPNITPDFSSIEFLGKIIAKIIPKNPQNWTSGQLSQSDISKHTKVKK